MADKKNILEEALLDIKNIQNALNANTKEILRSVAKEEIDSVVKESLTKEVYEEEDVDGAEEVPAAGAEPANSEMPTDLQSTDGVEEPTGVEPTGIDPMGGAGEEGMDGIDPMGGAPDELDMTQASDDDVIEIYKKLSGDDEIEIVGDEVHLNITEPGEYIVKAADITGAGPAGAGAAPEMGGEDDVDYEIEMGGEEGGEEPTDLVPVDDEGGEEGEGSGEEAGEETEEPIEEKISVGTGMSVGTHRNPKTAGSIGAGENPQSKLDESTKKLVSETTKKYNNLLTEAKKLKTENEEFRKALQSFRQKLVETVVYNSNLTYVTRLLMEHSTTKAEKQSIIKRFDEQVSNLVESKKLYKTIVNELETRKPVNETVENKIIKGVTTSSSKQLTESTAYVDPSTKRIKELMARVDARYNNQ